MANPGLMASAFLSRHTLNFRGADHKAGDTAQCEYLEINPNGKIPAMVDGDVTLFESMASNFYLVNKYGKALLPDNAADQAHALQWSFLGMTEIESKVIALFVELVRKPPAERSQVAVDAARTELDRMLAVLEKHLVECDYLLADRFTIADLNLASIISLYKFVGKPLEDLINPFPRTNGWLHDQCLARPAYKKVMAMEALPADLAHLK